MFDPAIANPGRFVGTAPSLLTLPVEIRLSIYGLVFEGAIATLVLDGNRTEREMGCYQVTRNRALMSFIKATERPVEKTLDRLFSRCLVKIGDQHQLMFTCPQIYHEAHHAALSSATWLFKNWDRAASIVNSSNFTDYSAYLKTLVTRLATLDNSASSVSDLPQPRRLILTHAFLMFEDLEAYQIMDGRELFSVARRFGPATPAQLDALLRTTERKFGISLLCEVYVRRRDGSTSVLPVGSLTSLTCPSLPLFQPKKKKKKQGETPPAS